MNALCKSLEEQELHPNTKALVYRFALAMADKLAAAEAKYGYQDNWRSNDWEDECREQLKRHIEKGDPVDVANYCAFLWIHNWPTIRTIKEENPSAGA